MRRVVLVVIGALLALPAVAQADVTVNVTVDGDDGQCQQAPAGNCTLREALTYTQPGEVVTVPSGTYAVVTSLVVGHDLTIGGAGARATTIRFEKPDGTGRVMLIESDVTVDLSRVTISGGNVPQSAGGGIRVENGGTLHLSDSTVEDNTAATGGGIWSSGTLDIKRSTIARNHAVGGEFPAFGGGIRILDGGGGTATIENSTISGNTAQDVEGLGNGGGIYTQANLDLTNVTLAENEAGTKGGGLQQDFVGSPTLRTLATNTLIAVNFPGNCGGTVSNGEPTDPDHFIQSTNGLSDEKAAPTCNAVGDGNQLVDDAGLDVLTDNGGETDTHALLPRSQAIDGGATPCVASDQRGVVRPQGAACDVGAFEAPAQISGAPLTIVADGRGRLQFLDADRGDNGSFFPSSSPVDRAHAGLEIVEGTAYHPLSVSRERVSGPTLIPGPVSELRSVYLVGDHLEVTETLSYADGSRVVDVTYSVKNVSGAGVTFRAAELADVQAGGSDSGRGFLLDRSGRFVGGWTPGGALIGIQEQTPWARYQTGFYGDVFDDFATAPLNDTLDPRLVDNGVGVEWALVALNPGGSTEFSLRWRVGADAEVNTATDAPADACTTAPGGCTLRDALLNSAPGDIVTIPQNDYDLTNGQLTVGHNLTVLGGGARTTRLTATVADSRVLNVTEQAIADVRGVTVTGGSGDLIGGGIRVDSGSTLRLFDSTVTENDTVTGAGILSAGRLELSRTTVSGNTATDDGGGIALTAGSAALTNTTISGNRAGGNGGGIHSAGGVDLTNVTIANNVGGGIFQQAGETLAVSTIVSGSCAGPGLIKLDHGLSNDPACVAGGSANRLVADAKLGPLTDNFGDTDTHLPQPESEAIDHGNDELCPSIDQRALPRPTGTACDIGAVEANQTPSFLVVVTEVINDSGGTATAASFTTHVRRSGVDAASPRPGDEDGAVFELPGGVYQVAADPVAGYTLTYGDDCANGSVTLPEGDEKVCTITANDTNTSRSTTAHLRVVTNVVNDSGGTKGPGDFSVRVRRGSADVAGSPKPGSAAGTSYTLSAGSYTVSAVAPGGYTVAIGGACSASGAVSLAAGTTKTCTVTGDDVQPEVHKTVVAAPAKGTVSVKLPGSNEFVELEPGQQIPLGTVFNTKRGRATIVAASDASGGTATADFYAGIFKLGQTKGKKPITVLTLVEQLTCKPSGRQATAAAKKRRKRRLWGDGRGRFRTRGKHSAATVVGTKWLVEDRCTSTLTRVARGKVSVRDFVKKKTVTVKAGEKYVARARR